MFFFLFSHDAALSFLTIKINFKYVREIMNSSALKWKRIELISSLNRLVKDVKYAAIELVTCVTKYIIIYLPVIIRLTLSACNSITYIPCLGEKLNGQRFLSFGGSESVPDHVALLSSTCLQFTAACFGLRCV